MELLIALVIMSDLFECIIDRALAQHSVWDSINTNVFGRLV